MIRIENHCVRCAVPNYPCIGNACPNRRVEVHYCDKCGGQLDEFFAKENGKEYCLSCYEENGNIAEDD